jgi:transposase
VQLKTLLNKVFRLKGFVYDKVGFEDAGGCQRIVASILPRKGSKPACSGCGRNGAVYDTSRRERRFQFVPLWGHQFYFAYRMRRVDCPSCGVKIEQVPWAEG